MKFWWNQFEIIVQLLKNPVFRVSREKLRLMRTTADKVKLNLNVPASKKACKVEFFPVDFDNFGYQQLKLGHLWTLWEPWSNGIL